jgi:hypothetical protein
LRICKVLSPQKNRKNIEFANRKSANCHICRSPNVTNFVSPQICGFAICGPPTSANWPSVSTTPVVPVGKFTAVFVDTSCKFATGVADTSGKFPTGVVDTGGVHNLRIFQKNLNDSNFTFRGWGEDDSWKKYHDTLPLKQNISGHNKY